MIKNENINCNIPVNVYRYRGGFHKNVQWNGCRETFHHWLGNQSLGVFYFWCYNATYEAQYIYDLETFLNIKDEYRSEVNSVNHKFKNEIIQIKSSPFWNLMSIRQYFLTAFLKATNKFVPSEKSFLECIRTAKYFKMKGMATPTTYFLQGKTVATGDGNWVVRNRKKGIVFSYPEEVQYFNNGDPKTKFFDFSC